MRYVSLVAVLLAATTASASEAREDAWFDDDWEAQVAKVNTGEVVFLAEPPVDPVHHHQSRIILDAKSLANGWVTLIQCHSHLDAVPRSQVLYHKTRMRDLSIVSYDNIGAAWVEGHTVQLADVEKGASLCVEARTRSLEINADGSFSLRGGPYMRRFLDGYYPMHVSIDIELPRGYLRFLDTDPESQDGFRVEQTAEGIHVDTWFEGRLSTEVRFEAGLCGVAEEASC
jgi:hypothetical protein